MGIAQVKKPPILLFLLVLKYSAVFLNEKASQSVASLWLIFRVLNKGFSTIFASIWLYRDLHPAIQDFSTTQAFKNFFSSKHGGHLDELWEASRS